MRDGAPPGPRLLAAYGAASVAIVFWGATPAATAVALSEIDSLAAGVLRTVIAAVFVLPIAWLGRLPLPQGRAQWGQLGISGLGGFVGFTLLFTHSLSLTSTAHAALILAGLPIFTGLIVAVVERVMPGPRWWAGVMIAFSGEALLIGAGESGGQASLAGDLYCVAAIVFASIGYVSGSRLAARLGTWSVTSWGITLAALVQLPLLPLVWRGTDWPAVTVGGWSGLVFTALFSSIGAYVAWYWALARGGVRRIALVQFAQPLVTLGLAVAFLGEVMTPVLLMSAALILTGVAVARRG